MIEVEGDFVVKTLSPIGASEEVRLMREAHRIASQTSWFYVPRVISFDGKNKVVLERIRQFVAVRELFEREVPEEGYVTQIMGKALAILHKSLSESGFGAAVHGDFNLINVAYDASHQRIILFDWSLNPALVQGFEWGPILDVSSFVRTALLQVRPLRRSGARWWTRVTRFIEAYEDESGENINCQELWSCLRSLQWCCMKKQIRQFKFIALAKEIYGLGYFVVFGPAICRKQPRSS